MCCEFVTTYNYVKKKVYSETHWFTNEDIIQILLREGSPEYPITNFIWPADKKFIFILDQIKFSFI